MDHCRSVPQVPTRICRSQHISMNDDDDDDEYPLDIEVMYTVTCYQFDSLLLHMWRMTVSVELISSSNTTLYYHDSQYELHVLYSVCTILVPSLAIKRQQYFQIFPTFNFHFPKHCPTLQYESGLRHDACCHTAAFLPLHIYLSLPGLGTTHSIYRPPRILWCPLQCHFSLRSRRWWHSWSSLSCQSGY